MKILFSIWLGKTFSSLSKILKLGDGSTWPGHLALFIEPRILHLLTSQLHQGVILVAGTNGKTTTAKMIDEILTKNQEQRTKNEIIRNESGANLLNGMASALISGTDWRGRINADWAIFETDEATLPLTLKEFTPRIVVFLNLFRDQLDRYGEVDLIADKWLKALGELNEETTLILNADDSRLAFIGKNLKTRVYYFGLENPGLFLPKMQHAVDSIYCPSCQAKLEFSGVYFAHLGIWLCSKCGLRRPKPDLSTWSSWSNLKGVYNRYNTLAAVLTAKTIGVKEEIVDNALSNFEPAFGRQEEMSIGGKKIRLLLSKNPASFNESLRTLGEFSGKDEAPRADARGIFSAFSGAKSAEAPLSGAKADKTVLLVLNDRIPDGRDVSWIWDVDFERIADYADLVVVSGDRVFDLALRLKYADFNAKKMLINTDLKEAVKNGLTKVEKGGTLYILPTYSAMLEVRKIMGGRKIL